MSYENNHSIQFGLDHLSQYEEVVDLEGKKSELDEVYAKAEAFDAHKNYLEENIMRINEYVYNFDNERHDYSLIVGQLNRELTVLKHCLEKLESGESND